MQCRSARVPRGMLIALAILPATSVKNLQGTRRSETIWELRKIDQIS